MANWDVFRELDNLRREMDEAFRGAGIYRRPLASAFLSPVTSHRFPLVNFSEDEGHVYIDALVPGVDPKDTDLTVLRNTITISAPVSRSMPGNPTYSEFELASYYRQFSIPESLDHEKAKADLVNGILTLRVPKAEVAKPRKIEITVS